MTAANSTATNTEDPSTWLPLDDLEPGFDANRAPYSSDLDGRTVTVTPDSGTPRTYTFASRRVHTGAGDPGSSYEAFDVDTDLYYVQFQQASGSLLATSLILDLAAGRSLTVTSVIGAPTDRPTAVTQSFQPGTIDGIPTTGRAPEPSRDLLGRRVLWYYSPQHSYEHIYLTEGWYTFHCLAGPERGLADTDACTYYRIRPGIYVFAWREKVVPCAAVTIADHRDFRSHGALFGLHEDGEHTVHFTFGAHGRLLGTTVYPGDLDAYR